MAAEHQIGSKSREVGWYDATITEIDGPVRELLEKYSNYAPAEVVPRVNEVVSVIRTHLYTCI